MTGMAKRFLQCDSGATAIEYAFIALLISVAIVAGASAVGNGVGNSFNDVADGFP
ncbi:MAG: Flp family type IVb pilin [Hyphomicrobiales bacterium]|nr:Flp family type IVb pilin [Hyphomicrobiales bacterium]MCP4999365.1 Flp family type IVb pilin [Hyphomicrobiales bacterium]